MIESEDTPMAEAVSDKREAESALVGGKLEKSEKTTSVLKVSLVVGEGVTMGATGDNEGIDVGERVGASIGSEVGLEVGI